MWTGDRMGDSPPSRNCGCGEDCDADKLWGDFEACAQNVTRLYREPDWRSLQTAAAATTQLYKSGLEYHKRGYERGYQAGRASLAKDLKALSGQKVEVNTLIDFLVAKYGRNGPQADRVVGGISPSSLSTTEDATALHLFQQALTPNPASSPQRLPELNSFLTTQLQRHRKRQRSPPSPSNNFMKRMRRN